MWRLVLSDRNFDYETVFHRMTFDEILEANAALNIQIEELENKRAEYQAEMNILKRR